MYEAAANKQGKTLISENKSNWATDGANIQDWLETVLNTTQERREVDDCHSPKIITDSQENLFKISDNSKQISHT